MSKSPEKLRIFVVDDEQIIASTLTLILQHNGYDATAFTQPMEALRAARIDAPALVISDVVMPLLTGVELAGLIRRSCPETRIVLFSGQAPPGNMLQIAEETGERCQFLSKPLHPIEFVKKIRAIMAELSTGTATVNSR